MERLDLEASVDSAVGALPRCDAHWGFLHVGECVCRGRLGTASTYEIAGRTLERVALGDTANSAAHTLVR